MKSKLIILIAAIVIALTQCDPMDGRLTILNGSKDTVFVAISPDGSIEEYPIKFGNADTLWDHTRYILPGGEDHPLSFGSNSWPNTINKNYKDSTLTVFIFDKKLLKTVPRDSLVLRQVYSKKYSYKVKDLERLHWQIEYR